MESGIMELNLHRMTVRKAQYVINMTLRTVSPSTYRLRLIHGYNGGTELRDMIRRVYRNHPKVLRIEIGLNPGETILVLRELF